MPAKKNLNISDDTSPESEDTFGGAFGGAFGSAFGDSFEVKFNTDGSTSKVKKKKAATTEKKVTPILRSSSRTFTIQTETSKETPAKKEESKNDAWVEELTRTFDAKKARPVESTSVLQQVEKPQIPTPTTSHTFTSPTPFRSKILTAEEKKLIQQKEAEARKVTATPSATTPKISGDDRGTAFAKTFIKKPGETGGFRKPLSPFTKTFTKYPPRTGPSYSDYRRTPRVKTKNAPTLKTRVSGKSHQNKLELTKESGADINRRAPVVTIMGHVDHGKSTLLDYIRKSNIVDREVGGITQKMSAYEVEHNGQKITFLDTPGHEAFTSMRARGASAADIAILIVSAEDGVKPQTLDALKAITDAKVPYFIGASKIDRPNADIEKTKQSLAENSIYVEGYGGDISLIPFSGKTGDGVEDLLDMILLMADVADIKAEFDIPAECLVIESSRDKVRGIQATLIVRNGTLKVGSYIVSGGQISPIRSIENYEGKQLKEALPGQPVRVMGWIAEPRVGDMCTMAVDKDIAELVAAEQTSMLQLAQDLGEGTPVEVKGGIPVNIRVLYGLEKDDTWTLPVVLKADSVGTLDALKQEIGKIKLDRINIRIIRSETGDINENDMKLAQGSRDSVVLGYNTKIDAGARRLAETTKTTVETFDIIYKLIEWVAEEAVKRAPKIRNEESHAALKVLKVFSSNKHKQVLGGRVETGTLVLGNTVKILRRDNEIGRGEVVELQQMRVATKQVEEGSECGLMVESKIEIVVGDVLSAVSFVER